MSRKRTTNDYDISGLSLVRLNIKTKEFSGTASKNPDNGQYEKPIQEYADFIRNFPDGMGFTDGQGIIIEWNPVAEILTGISSQEAIGLPISDVFYRIGKNFIGTREKMVGLDGYLKKALQKSSETQPPLSFEENLLLPGRGFVYIEYYIFPLRGNNRSGIGLTIRDISHRKKDEQNAHLFKGIFQNMEHGIAILDPDMKYLEQNQAHASITGYNDEELLKSNPSIYLGEKLYSEIFTVYDYQSAFQGELKARTKSGKEIYIDLVMFPVLYDDKVICHVSYLMDITLRKKSEQDLFAAKRKAEQADMLKTAFLSNMSHEIRTPMNSILGFSSLLEEPDTTEEQRSKYIKYINRNGENLLNLIGDIIDISKIESNQLKIQKSKFNVYEFLEEVYASIKEVMIREGKDHLQLRKNYSSEQLILYTDSYRLRQILINLLHNAVKFTDQGYIEFGYMLRAEKLQFFVKDTGIGIPRERQEHIFERFRKLELSREKFYGGAGLGLAISRQLTELLGGSILVESETGKGSTFFFDIPYSCSGKQIIQPDVLNVQDKDFVWTDKKILIVEDDLFNFELLSEFLDHTGVKILHAGDGKEGVEMFGREEDIDLIIMDIHLPQLDGYEAIKLIRKVNPYIPIIVQSAYVMHEDMINAESAGCNIFLTKPLNKQLLISKISRFFNTKK